MNELGEIQCEKPNFQSVKVGKHFLNLYTCIIYAINNFVVEIYLCFVFNAFLNYL